VIGLGQEISEPADRQLTVVETLLQTMRAQMAVQDVCQAQLGGYADNHWNVINPFMLDRKFVCHAPQHSR
jgi:hypothetical protein